MTLIRQRLKCILAAGAVAFSLTGAPAAADDRELDALFAALKHADAETYRAIEAQIWEMWSASGSPAMDLLLERGRAALSAGDVEAAIEHFTALVDHAPDFAEGYNARATAYYQAQLYGPSVADIRETLARNPRHFGALSGLALIFEEVGMTDGALEAYREVYRLNPQREGVAEAIERLEREVEGRSL